MQNAESSNSRSNFRNDFNFMTHVLKVVSFPVVLCITRWGTWGTRYLGLWAVIGFFWPLIFAGLYSPHPQIHHLVLFWYASFVLLVCHRIRGIILDRRGRRCHSMYCGLSWFEKADGSEDQEKVNNRTSLLALGSSIVLYAVLSRPLGAMFFVGSVAKLISDVLSSMSIAARIRQMHDARIENEYFLDLYRRKYGTD